MKQPTEILRPVQVTSDTAAGTAYTYVKNGEPDDGAVQPRCGEPGGVGQGCGLARTTSRRTSRAKRDFRTGAVGATVTTTIARWS